MKTIRRLYFYLVALISLEVVIWGLVNLLRTTFASGAAFPGAETLSQALALIFVGVPIFIVHWLWAQNVAQRDPEENSAGLRALFLYAILIATLVPVTQNILALINRSSMVGAGIDSYRSLIGGSQSWIDNLIAIGLNLLAALYFYNVLRSNWNTLQDKNDFADIRRFYRHLWVLYALFLMVFGIQEIVRFLFYQPGGMIGFQGREIFINGLAFIVVGTPIWVYTWGLCQKALEEPGEADSRLHLGVLYFFSLAGVVTVLGSAGVVIAIILRRVLGESMDWNIFASSLGTPLSVGIPLAVVWGYYGYWLNRQINSTADETNRAGLKRFYFYLLSLIGLAATFVGLALLLSFIIATTTSNALWGDVLRQRVSGAIATLVVGMPLWVFAWRPMQADALSSGDGGDHARRSIMRRSYLYLVIFATVIGGMTSAIYLVYTVLVGIIGTRSSTFVSDALNGLQLLALFASFLLYHWSALRGDGNRAATALLIRQERFAVLIFEQQGSSFGEPIENAIKRSSPGIPVALQPIENGIPDGAGGVQAVILSSTLALSPPEALRLWLREYEGKKIIVPTETGGWYWPGTAVKNGAVWASQVVRQLSEGQEVRLSPGNSGWITIAYIFAALFALQLLILLVAFSISMIAR